MTRTAYLAAEGFEAELERELGEIEARHERLFVAPGPPRPAAWAQNVWHDPERLAIASINDAARQLKARQRNWAFYPTALHRRGALIVDALPHVSQKPIAPYSPLPAAPLGSFTLIDRDTLLASARCESPFAHGEVRFLDDREGPPSRAYLKLWEVFTLRGEWPRPNERAIDLGSAPGGWTWVLAERGARVVSVDKAELDPRVAAMPNVEHRKESAFAIEPFEVDWWCSDIICYPTRALVLVERWRPYARKMVCTLKFQGETDHATAAAFAAIEGSRLVHLSHNRHELTWTVGL
ncbi:MAG: SAM-dependent methyltransferase [Sandaracinaceae bacterium]